MHLYIWFTVCLILPSFCPSTLSYRSFLPPHRRPSAEPPHPPPPHLSLALGFCEPPTVIRDCNRRRINEAEPSRAAVLKVEVASLAKTCWLSFTSQNIWVMNVTQNHQTEPPRRHQSCFRWQLEIFQFSPLFRTRFSETSEESHCNDRKINGYVCPAATEEIQQTVDELECSAVWADLSGATFRQHKDESRQSRQMEQQKKDSSERGGLS